MRIGIDAVPFAFEQAGIGRYLGNVLEEMYLLDPDVEFLLYSPLPVSLPMRTGNWKLRITPRGLARRPSIWAQVILPSLLASDKVDCFWSQPTNLPIFLKRPCFRVLTVHDLVPYEKPKSMRLRALFRMRVMLGREARKADVVIADSQATALQASHYLRIPRDRVRVVYAAAPSWCQPMPRGAARNVVSVAYGLAQEYVLCVGTVEPRKDHMTLLRAVDSVPGIPLLVIAGGRGWRSRRIVDQIRAHEISGRVRYIGRVDDSLLPALYSAAKLSVYPSVYEGFGLPVLESMACGCPVLSSDSSCLPEVGGTAARYFRTGDAVSLAEALTGLLANQSELAEMSEAGLARARTFSFRRAAEQLLEVIREGVGVSMTR
ncbi:MAG TPA: glycosyltransferase family 1 protein [bacterium]|nr:glycosyltransferase family 1 protein [bacterium]